MLFLPGGTVASPNDSEVQSLQKLNAKADGQDGGIKVSATITAEVTDGFGIPQYDYVATTYVGSTNNINTITYKSGGSGGTTLATLTITYVGGAPSTDNALVATVTKS